MRRSSNARVILLVEDNPADARLTKEAFQETGISHRLYVVEDGVEAMSFLQRKGGYADAVRPELILLDLNLPKKDGRQVLLEIKSDESLRRIPVVVLTTSVADNDILRAYESQANAYITKPVDMDRFLEIVNAIDKFWFKLATLPLN
ncbi:MAG: response regulator [Bacteroidetes bacterium]|nr:response regulator [Bacteroidota bacterium]